MEATRLNPVKLFKLFRYYEKLQDILKEKIPMNKKAWQIVHLLVTLGGVIGVPTLADHWLQSPEHAGIYSILVAVSVGLHAGLPSIFGGPTQAAEDAAQK